MACYDPHVPRAIPAQTLVGSVVVVLHGSVSLAIGFQMAG
jgi:hypothetical protein